MPSFEEAQRMVLARVPALAPVRMALGEVLGRVAAEDVFALEPVPLFTNSAMDGFALRAADVAGCAEAAPVRLRVAGGLAAGQVPGEAVEPGMALRIMTGAPMPEGADAVVPVEWTRHGRDWVEVSRPLRPGANVRLAGEDLQAGGRVVSAGTVLGPAEIGVLAATGFAQVTAIPAVRVAVITTGDELVDCAEMPGPGRIRDANIHALCAQVAAAGGVPVPFPRVPDREEEVVAALREALASADVILTTGGVSVGDWDFVKPALERLGAEPVFWRVAQKPGGPLGFWMLQGRPVFGIPGNPVAAMLMVETYVRPALLRMMGFRKLLRPERQGVLEQPWRKTGADGRVHLLRVVAREEEGRLRASLTGPQGSGILSSMLRANALAVIPEDVTAIAAGGEVPLRLITEPEDH